MKIKGTIRYIELETGFWGIESDRGAHYVPVNMPEQLKIEGRRVEVEVRFEEEMAGLEQWGRYVYITAFET